MKAYTSKLFVLSITTLVLVFLFFINTASVKAQTASKDSDFNTYYNQTKSQLANTLAQEQSTCGELNDSAQKLQCNKEALNRYNEALQKLVDEGKKSEYILNSDNLTIDWGIFFNTIVGFADYTAGIFALPAFAVVAGLTYLVLGIMSLLVLLSGFIFDMITVVSISNFKVISDASAVVLVWTNIRNIINVAFIFILLYISISIILGKLGPKQKSSVASVVIAAVTINFSMFVTKLVIDIGNWIAIQLGSVVLFGGDSSAGTLSEILMQAISAPSLLNYQNLSSSGQIQTLFTMYIQIVFLGVVIWAFMSAGLLLIGRLVMLIFLMASSPVGFVGDAIPWIKDKSDQWRTTLLDQVLVAPIFFFFMTIAFSMAKQQTIINTTIKAAMANSTWGSLAGISALFNYIIVIAIIVTGVKTTKKLSGVVAEWIGKIGKAIAIAIAVAITGGLALAAAPAAGAAGAAGTAASRGLLGRFGSTVGKTARGVFTGAVSKQKGLAGEIGRSVRSGAINSVLDITKGKLNLGKIQDDYKKINDKQKGYIRDEFKEIGPAKAEEKVKQVESTLKNIENLARERVRNTDQGKSTTDEIDKSKNEISKLKKEIESYNIAIADQKNRGNDTTKMEAQLKSKEAEVKQHEDNVLKATQALKVLENNFLDVFKVKVATDMGTSIDKLNETLKKAQGDVVRGRDNQAKFASKIEGGTLFETGLIAKERVKLAEELRAAIRTQNEGDVYKDIRRMFKKMQKQKKANGENVDDDDDDDDDDDTSKGNSKSGGTTK